MVKKLTDAQKKKIALMGQAKLIAEVKKVDVDSALNDHMKKVGRSSLGLGKPINLSANFAPIIKENRARLRDIKMQQILLDDEKDKSIAAGEITPSKPQTLFDKAKKLVYGERQLEYGDFKAGYAQTLELYRAWNFGKLEIRSVSDLMMLMVFIKLARNRSATKEDNILDAIGYLEMHFRSLPSQIGNEK